jgi:hypothetical protein
MGTLTELVDIIEQRMRNAKANIDRYGKDSNVGRLFTPKYELLESIMEEWGGKPFNASESNCTIHGVMQSALPETPDDEIYDAAAELYKAGKMLNATLLVKRHTTMNPAQAKQYCDSHFA